MDKPSLNKHETQAHTHPHFVSPLFCYFHHYCRYSTTLCTINELIIFVLPIYELPMYTAMI